MKVRCLVLLGAGLLLAADNPKDANKKDLDRLQGTWIASSVEYNGDKVEADIVKNLRVTIDGEKMKIKGDSTELEKYGKATLKLDPTTTPKIMDVTLTSGNDKGTTFEGIYEVKKDEWKLCVKLTGKERPAKLQSTADGSEVLAIFKREAK